VNCGKAWASLRATLRKRPAFCGVMLSVFSTSETYLGFFQATVQSSVHPELDLAPGPDCACETSFAPSGASQPIPDGKPTFRGTQGLHFYE
jgi:hypothetical protein